MMRSIFWFFLTVICHDPEVEAFSTLLPSRGVRPRPTATGRPWTQLGSSPQDNSLSTPSAVAAPAAALTVSLTKPLGLILEEVQAGQPRGVWVANLAESGSAVTYNSQQQQPPSISWVGAQLRSVQGQRVDASTYEQVMEKLVAAPTTVDLEFVWPASASSENVSSAPDSSESTAVTFPLGTTVTIQISDTKQSFQAQVGDNLRQALLQQGFPLYQGLRQQLGNCGGAGQCTFCAVDFLESEGWEERSDYENQKLTKYPGARLACLNNIQGPVTLRKTQR